MQSVDMHELTTSPAETIRKSHDSFEDVFVGKGSSDEVLIYKAIDEG